jgi:hypothetical protein
LQARCGKREGFGKRNLEPKASLWHH